MTHKPVTLNTPEEVMAITKAWLEGKPLQMQNPNTLEWYDRSELSAPMAPYFSQSKYRIKPSPVETEVWYNPKPAHDWYSIYDEGFNANVMLTHGYRKILLREVLPEEK